MKYGEKYFQVKQVNALEMQIIKALNEETDKGKQHQQSLPTKKHFIFIKMF